MKLSIRAVKLRIPKPIRHKRFLVGLVVLFVVWNFINRGAGDLKLITTARVERKSIQSQVSASGTIKSDSQTVLRFPAGGKVIWVGVTTDQKVTAGTAIASVDPTQLQGAVRQAQQNVVAADAVLSQVYDEIGKYTQAESFDQKIRRTTAEKAKNQAYDALLTAQKNLTDATLYAPIDGTIVSLPVTIGEQTLTTTDVAEIADLTKIEFVAQVDETDVGKVAIGQSAKITLDAFPSREFGSTITKIGSKSAVGSTGATVFNVTFDLSSPEVFRLGENGEASVVTDQKDNTIVVPIEAVIDNYVYIYKNGEYKKQMVEKGIESDTDVEITNGLTDGAKVATGGISEIGKKSLLQKFLGIFK
jgi:RND family efflux transporter MFP subunit